MKKIKIGELNSNQLANTFGTQKQKEKIKKGKYLSGKEKELLLKKASKFCEIEDLGQGNFKIHKVFNIDINKDELILPLLKGLSQYITPLILIKLLEEQDENYKITLPFLGWAKKFEMINENYPFIKYHQKQSSEYLKIDEDTMFDYFEKMDDCIKYYLEKILKALGDRKGLDLIEVDSITMVRKIIIESEIKNHNIKIECGYKDEMISDEDRKFVIDCENVAKKKASIVDNKEKFYGLKSYIYKNTLKELLKEKHILFTYQAYNIFCKNKEEVSKVLSKFKSVINNDENLIKIFNEVFIEYIENKAKKIQKREQEKLDEVKNNEPEKINYIKKYRLAEAYLNNFKVLSELTVHKDIKSLKDKINVNTTIEDIMEEFNITIEKK